MTVTSTAETAPSRPKPDHEVVVVGAGFAGIGAGIALKRAGIEDFVLLERAGDIGGTWRDNTYPGLAVDIPSFTYSFAFEPRPEWSRVYAPGPEIKAYADHCADKYEIRPHVRLNTTVTHAVWDDAADLWRLTTNGQPITARHLLSCQGALTTPSTPNIDGLDDFEGFTMHTARWDHSHDLTGERVAVIGTGATALQMVPQVAKQVEKLEVFQRTPIWVFPKFDPKLSPRVQALFRKIPLTQRIARLCSSGMLEFGVTLGVVYHRQLPLLTKLGEGAAKRHLKRQVKDKALREKLTPKYSLGCKRPSFSNSYLRTFTKDHVELVTDGIDRITKAGILTKDGREHEFDTIILATGFKVFDISFPVIGRDGVEITEFWRENRRQSYEGSTVPGFPNFFLVPGPYGNVGFSWFQMIDTQIRHALRVITETGRRGATRAAVKQEAHDRYHAWVMRKMPNTVFLSSNCAGSNSYYFDEHGDAPWQRPSSVPEARVRSHRFNLDDYEYTAR